MEKTIDIIIDDVNSESSQYIATALAYDGMLSVTEFVKYVNYPIDSFMIDKFWYTMRKKRYIYVNAGLIEWMGYVGSDMKLRKQAFMKLLCNTIGAKENVDYYYYSNDEYKQFIDSSVEHMELYPAADKSNGKGKTKHLLLTPTCLVLAMMKLTTDRALIVNQYCISLADLFQTYTSYLEMSKIQQGSKNNAVRLAKNKEEHDRQLILIQQEMEKMKEERDAANEKCDRLGTLAMELIEGKMHPERAEEDIYIGATMRQAEQGLFKVSMTTNMKARNATHNTTHPIGDKFEIFNVTKCRNARGVERRLMDVLVHFRPSDNREFYKIPYDLLLETVEEVTRHANIEEINVNKRMEIMMQRRKEYERVDWKCGVVPIQQRKSHMKRRLTIAATRIETTDVHVQQDNINRQTDAGLVSAVSTNTVMETAIVQNISVDTQVDEVPFTFTVGGMSPSETEAFIISHMQGYQLSLGSKRKPSWATLSAYLIGKLKDINIGKPHLKCGQEQITQLCKKHHIVFKSR